MSVAKSHIRFGWGRIPLKRVLKAGQEGVKIGPFGSALKLDSLSDSGVPVYGQENVIRGDFGLGKRFLPESRVPEFEQYQTVAGDLLVTMMGSAGRVAVVPDDAPPGIIDSHLVRLRLEGGSADTSFVRYFIGESSEARRQLDLAANGSIMQGLNSTIIKNLVVPSPPIAEQRRIAAFLDYETARIDELLHAQQLLAGLLDEERSGVIRAAFTAGFLPEHRPVASSSRWFPTVPSGWSVLPLKRLLTANDGGAWGTDPDGERDTIVLRSTEQSVDGEWRITDPAVRSLTSAERAKTLLREGDLLVTKSSGSEVHIGKTTYVTAEVAGLSASYSNFMQRLRVSEKLHPRVVWYVMNSEIGRRQLAFASNTTTGLSNLNAELLGGVHVPVAPKAEQLKLLDYLDGQTKRLRSLSYEVDLALVLLRERRSALITAAVTGEIDVSSWRPPDDWLAPEPA